MRKGFSEPADSFPMTQILSVSTSSTCSPCSELAEPHIRHSQIFCGWSLPSHSYYLPKLTHPQDKNPRSKEPFSTTLHLSHSGTCQCGLTEMQLWLFLV
jgi:hypothetical protein